jgi:hypothetical protein
LLQGSAPHALFVRRARRLGCAHHERQARMIRAM